MPEIWTYTYTYIHTQAFMGQIIQVALLSQREIMIIKAHEGFTMKSVKFQSSFSKQQKQSEIISWVQDTKYEKKCMLQFHVVNYGVKEKHSPPRYRYDGLISTDKHPQLY